MYRQQSQVSCTCSIFPSTENSILSPNPLISQYQKMSRSPPSNDNHRSEPKQKKSLKNHSSSRKKALESNFLKEKNGMEESNPTTFNKLHPSSNPPFNASYNLDLYQQYHQTETSKNAHAVAYSSPMLSPNHYSKKNSLLKKVSLSDSDTKKTFYSHIHQLSGTSQVPHSILSSRNHNSSNKNYDEQSQIYGNSALNNFKNRRVLEVKKDDSRKEVLNSHHFDNVNRKIYAFEHNQQKINDHKTHREVRFEYFTENIQSIPNNKLFEEQQLKNIYSSNTTTMAGSLAPIFNLNQKISKVKSNEEQTKQHKHNFCAVIEDYSIKQSKLEQFTSPEDYFLPQTQGELDLQSKIYQNSNIFTLSKLEELCSQKEEIQSIYQGTDRKFTFNQDESDVEYSRVLISCKKMLEERNKEFLEENQQQKLFDYEGSSKKGLAERDHCDLNKIFSKINTATTKEVKEKKR